MSRALLEEQRRIWAGKPVLERVYEVWFAALLAKLPATGRVLEVGAGPGFLSEHARRRRTGAAWVALDVLEAPWNDVAGDALRLPFRDGAFDAIAGVDVVHHLGRPEAFFAEAVRVMGPGGRIAVVEPWLTPLSYPIYRWLHQEGCRPGADPWTRFAGGGSKPPFEGDNGLPTRLVRDTPLERWRGLGLNPPEVQVLNGFAYLLSLGFRKPSLLPGALAPLLLRADRGTAALSRWLGLRALVVWDALGGLARP